MLSGGTFPAVSGDLSNIMEDVMRWVKQDLFNPNRDKHGMFKNFGFNGVKVQFQ